MHKEKIIESIKLQDWEIETDTGWKNISYVHKTIPFNIWKIATKSFYLECADTHILYDETYNELFAKDAKIGDKIITKNGIEDIISIIKTNIMEPMYDVSVDSNHQRYYSNGVLSHNTTTTIAYVLWATLFKPDYSVAILANKGVLAREILDRYQKSYAAIPHFLQQGVVEFNKSSVKLENGSRVLAAATSSSSIRGNFLSHVIMDEYAHVPNNIAEEFFASVYPVISSGKDSKLTIISCVTKNTYMFTNYGIQQLSEYIDITRPPNPIIGYEIPRYYVYGMDGIRSGIYIVNSGKCKTKIITSKSSSIECSTEHKFWARKNGKFECIRAKNLDENCFISIKYGENIWGNNDDISEYISLNIEHEKIIPKTLTVELAYFIGVFLAKGHIDDISSAFNLTSLIHFLEYLGIDISRNHNEHIIPKRLFSCSKKIICSLLSGIFDAKGNVFNGNIFISSTKEFIDQIRILLLNIGILSEYATKNSSHELNICDPEMCNLFYNEIGFKFLEKQTAQNIIPLSGHNNLRWEKIESIIDSENEVYDISLDHIEGDDWCHSVLYNGMVNFQTPAGLNHFYKLFTDAKAGRNDYAVVDIHWTQIPGRTESWKDEYIRNTSDILWKAEIECEFLGSSNTLVSGEKLATLSYNNPIKNYIEAVIYEEPIQDGINENDDKIITAHTYVVCVDVSEGKNLDYSAFCIIDVSVMPYKQVAVYRNNSIPPILYPTVIKALAVYYNNAYVLVEVNNNPQVADLLIEELGYDNVFRVSSGNKHKQHLTLTWGKTVANGVKMSPLVKRMGCSMLKTLIENDKLVLTDFETISELTTFIQTGPTFKAEEGRHDDLAMCIHGDSDVRTENGLMKMKYLVDTEYNGRVWSLGNDGHFTLSKVIGHSSKVNLKKVWITLKGDSGELTCTTDHRCAYIKDILNPVIDYIEADQMIGKFSIVFGNSKVYNKQQISAIIGTLLGNSFISKTKLICIDDNKKYHEHKCLLFKGTLDENLGKNEYFFTKVSMNEQIIFLEKLFYCDNKKGVKNILNYIDGIVLAYWYMDNGYIENGDVVLCNEFSLTENYLLMEYLDIKFNIICDLITIDGKFCLFIKEKESYNLWKIIIPYIIVGLEHKIPIKYLEIERNGIDADCLGFGVDRICNVSVCNDGGLLYDIEVEGVHNFVVNDRVVHNCLVLFAWLTTQKLFKELLEQDLRKQLQYEHFQSEEDLLPVIGMTNGMEEETFVEDNSVWTVYDHFYHHQTYFD